MKKAYFCNPYLGQGDRWDNFKMYLNQDLDAGSPTKSTEMIRAISDEINNENGAAYAILVRENIISDADRMVPSPPSAHINHSDAPQEKNQLRQNKRVSINETKNKY